MSPTARSLGKLRASGWIACVVESWVPRVNIRRDAFGIADILAAKPPNGRLLVQATSDSNVSARLKKIKASPYTARLLASGIAIQVWGWGKRKNRWQCRVVEVT